MRPVSAIAATLARSVSSDVQSAPYTVSVIVPTRNRPERLSACLAALSAQDYGCDRFEIVIVDDGSDVSLEPVVAPFRDRLQLVVIRQANAGPARARNTGAARASGALLAFTDDDCEPHRDWLSILHARTQQWPDRLIGGHTENALPENLYSTASQMLVDYLYDYHATARATDERTAPATPPFFTSNNFAVPAPLFQRVGGFAESFPLAAGEDREFCDRWQEHGYHLLHARDAVVKHGHGLSLGRFWRQHMNYGRGAWHLRQARLDRAKPALRIEPVAFYWRLVTYPLRVATPGKALALMGLMGLSQVANTWGFVSERRRLRRPGP